jgi:hypothetical protein
LYAYSPYHHVVKKTKYPAILLTTASDSLHRPDLLLKNTRSELPSRCHIESRSGSNLACGRKVTQEHRKNGAKAILTALRDDWKTAVEIKKRTRQKKKQTTDGDLEQSKDACQSDSKTAEARATHKRREYPPFHFGEFIALPLALFYDSTQIIRSVRLLFITHFSELRLCKWCFSAAHIFCNVQASYDGR